MTGELLELEKESFWKEHQHTLVRLRQELVSGKKIRSQHSPAESVRSFKSGSPAARKNNKLKHPPYGKYRRSPSPYLPKLNSEKKPGKSEVLQQRKFDVVPPVKPKLAFINAPEDYDSWGEDSDSYKDEDDDESQNTEDKHKQTNSRQIKYPKNQKSHYKPQHPPTPTTSASSSYIPPAIVYGAPFPVFYPRPPRDFRRVRQHPQKKFSKNLVHQGKHNHGQVPGTVRSGNSASEKKKISGLHQSLPVYMSYPLMPAVTVMYPPTLEEDEVEDEEEDQLIKSALSHWKQHPLFASDFTEWFVQDCLHTELLPDFLIDIFDEIKHMPYNHPAYVPSLYACEDILADHVSEMVIDIVRQTLADLGYKDMDERRLHHDSQEEFLSSLIEDVVTMTTQEIVRSTVIQLAEDYMITQYATNIFNSLLNDYLHEISPEMLEDVMFDVIAETFINSEVIAPEVKEEAEIVAKETVQHYDNKIMRRELKEVSQLARNKLADVVMMEFILSVMSQQRKLWTEDDYLIRYLDDAIFNESIAQMVSVQKERDKTLHCKPLHKLHEKAVSDVALDVFLQQLTRCLDEDLIDVDDYEKGMTDDTVYPFPMMAR